MKRCFIVLLLVAYAVCTMQDLLNAMTPSQVSPGCIRFSPYVNGLTPAGGAEPTSSLIGTLLDTLLAQTIFRCIMIDNFSGVYTTVIQLAVQKGFKIFGIIYINPGNLF
jgi:hypothetical protein